DNLGNDILLFTSENLAEEALKKLHFDVSYYASTNIKEIELYNLAPIRIEVDWQHPQVEERKWVLTMLSHEEFKISGIDNTFLDYFIPSNTREGMDKGLVGKTFKFGETVETEDSKFVVNLTGSWKPGREVGIVFHNPSSLIDKYSKVITVKPLYEYGSVLEVGLVTTVVDKGRDYVNALMDSFMEYDLKEKNMISENTLKFIDEQLFLVEDSLRSVEKRMQRFKVSNKFLDVNAEFGGVLSNIQTLEANIQTIDFELAYYKSLKNYLEQKGSDYQEIVAPSVVGISDALLNGLIQNLVQLSLER